MPDICAKVFFNVKISIFKVHDHSNSCFSLGSYCRDHRQLWYHGSLQAHNWTQYACKCCIVLKFLYIQALYLADNLFFLYKHVLNSEIATVMFQMRLSGFHVVVSDLRRYCIAGFIKSFSPKGSRNQLYKSWRSILHVPQNWTRIKGIKYF